MANRTGIELLPGVCRVVEVQSSTGWFGRNRAKAGASRVKTFYEIPYSPDSPGSCAAELGRVLGRRSREIQVAIWGLRSTYQTLYLPQAERADLEVMARREARSKTSGVQAAASTANAAITDGIMVGEHREGGRIEVGYVSVTPGEVQSRIQPFLNAGLAIAGVVTPAVAHAGLVRQRWGQFADAATAVLAVNARVTAMTVARGGVVLFSRELPWGHETDRADRGYVFDAAAFAGQLASELRRSLVFVKQQSKVDVSHVLVCGDLPDLRALTGPLMHELNVEVETLDSLEGFDVAHLPEPADEFRTKIGALRTAWALAVDASSSVNLQPREVGKVRFTSSLDKRMQTRLAVAAVTGIVIAGVAWAGSEFFVRDSRTRIDALRRQVSTLEPEIQRIEANRRAAALLGVRAAALQAFVSQGPRLARVLESIASGSPGQVVIHTMSVAPGVGSWRVTINGQAIADTPVLAQSVFNQFMRGATASAVLGPAVRPPTTNVRTDEPVQALAVAAGAGGGGASLMTARNELPPQERPRNVVISDWGNLSASDRRLAGTLGRRPLRIQLEPHWYLHPGGPPKEMLDGIAAYNAQQAQWDRDAVRATGGQTTDPVKRRAGSVLDFSVEFEVRK